MMIREEVKSELVDRDWHQWKRRLARGVYHRSFGPQIQDRYLGKSQYYINGEHIFKEPP